MIPIGRMPKRITKRDLYCLALYGSLPSSSTPQEVLARIQQTQMAQVRAKAEAAANAANLPKFYNPLSVNAAKLAEQQQKRKLLWSKKADSVVDAHEVSSINPSEGHFFVFIIFLAIKHPTKIVSTDH